MFSNADHNQQLHNIAVNMGMPKHTPIQGEYITQFQSKSPTRFDIQREHQSSNIFNLQKTPLNRKSADLVASLGKAHQQHLKNVVMASEESGVTRLDYPGRFNQIGNERFNKYLLPGHRHDIYKSQDF